MMIVILIRWDRNYLILHDTGILL